MVFYDEGDKVFAKVRGFPPWPGKVMEIANEKQPHSRYHIFFYTTKQSAWLPASSLSPFCENYSKLKGPRKTKYFNQAMEDILKDLNLQEKKLLVRAFRSGLAAQKELRDRKISSEAGKTRGDPAPSSDPKEDSTSAKGAVTGSSTAPVESAPKIMRTAGPKPQQASDTTNTMLNAKHTPAPAGPSSATKLRRKPGPKPRRTTESTDTLNPDTKGAGASFSPVPNTWRKPGPKPRRTTESTDSLNPDTKDAGASFSPVPNTWRKPGPKSRQSMDASDNPQPDTKGDGEYKIKVNGEVIVVPNDENVLNFHFKALEVMEIDIELRAALSIGAPTLPKVVPLLRKLLKVDFTPMLLKRVPDIIDTISKVRRYCGSPSDDPRSTADLATQTQEIRELGDSVYEKFEEVFPPPPGKGFCDHFQDIYSDFQNKTKGLSTQEYYDFIGRE